MSDADKLEQLYSRRRALERARHTLDEEIAHITYELSVLTEDLVSTDEVLVIKDLDGIKMEVPWPLPAELRVKKIAGIKSYRARTGLGLADSKRAVETALELLGE